MPWEGENLCEIQPRSTFTGEGPLLKLQKEEEPKIFMKKSRKKMRSSWIMKRKKLNQRPF